MAKMTLDSMFKLKIGDKIVQVRKHYQNYDHTRVPCEPKVYTVSWRCGSEMCMEEAVNIPFYHSDDKIIYGGRASCWDNSQICADFETFEDYISGNYPQGIILDKRRHKCIEDFLEEKRILDYEKAKKISDDKYKELQKKHYSK